MTAHDLQYCALLSIRAILESLQETNEYLQCKMYIFDITKVPQFDQLL